MVKKTQEIGAFPAYAPEKPEKPGFSGCPEAIGPREECPHGPITKDFMRLQAALEPLASTTLSVRSLMRADLPVRPRR
jgi:hypothetical protein